VTIDEWASSALFETTTNDLGDDARMTVDIPGAVSFAATHARVLDRHRLRLLLDPGNRGAAEQTLTALDAYRNPDGGYGWGLEPDLRSASSQPSTALHAFEVWAEVGSGFGPQAGAVCDWLASVSLADGGLPFALPIADPAGSAPWWLGADNGVSSLQITAAVAANAHRVAVHDPAVAGHRWLREASRYCLDTIGALDATPPAYALSFSLRFLDAVAGTVPEAQSLIDRMLGYLPSTGVMPVEGGAAGEMLRPLDYAPEPDTAVRGRLPAPAVAADVQRLAALQQPDGGWPVDWAVSSPAAAVEWRGYVTVRAMGQLMHNGGLS
jgi:hypothetical protein